MRDKWMLKIDKDNIGDFVQFQECPNCRHPTTFIRTYSIDRHLMRCMKCLTLFEEFSQYKIGLRVYKGR